MIDQTHKSFSLPAILQWMIAGSLLGGCDAGGGSAATGASEPAQLSRQAALGEEIFHDASLSASGRQSCATCHVPSQAHAGADGAAVPVGGTGLDQRGLRNAPSLRYGVFTPAFHFDAEGTPIGGLNRDGRADSLLDQARRPFLTDFEMANASVAEFADRLSRATYAAEFRAVFGEQIFALPEEAMLRAVLALQRYQQEDTAEFAPFTSKFDRFLAGTAQLSVLEQRGFELFNNPQKGNCAACHPSGRGPDGALPLFTDFTYDNIGVPRNAAIPVNDNTDYFDLGLCGPLRLDLGARGDLCGAFKVPTLRNIALTAPYFHNGRFQTLREVVGFYVRRDTNPEEWYPTDGNGVVRKFDDLPAAFIRNVNVTESPYNRQPGDLPALSADEIDAVVAFLETLTDGYQP
jgi:cytochrome c peroxidase